MAQRPIKGRQKNGSRAKPRMNPYVTNVKVHNKCIAETQTSPGEIQTFAKTIFLMEAGKDDT